MDPIRKWRDIYMQFWSYRDHRVDGWLLMDSIKPILFFLVLYFIIVKYGPKSMLHRPPYNLKWIIFIYNVSIAIYNFHIFKELTVATYRQGYNWWCQPVQLSTDPEELRIISAFHLYFISKLLEFIDTVFFIARKKNNQLTFLHVYHHSTMLIVCWIMCRWVPGGNSANAALLNAFVHVFMYGYYGLSVLGPQVAKYLWWKRYLTIFQLIQFMTGLVIGIHMFWFGCDYAKWMQYVTVFYTLSYLILFGRFYLVTYVDGRLKMQKHRMMCDENAQQMNEKQLSSRSSSDTNYRRMISTLTPPSSG